MIDKLHIYEKVKGRLTLRLMNPDSNTEFLKTHPHKTFLDLAAVVAVRNVQKACHIIQTCDVDDSLLQHWEVSFYEVYEQARINVISETPVFMPLSDLLGDLVGQTDLPLYVLTNDIFMDGANRMVDEGFLKSLSEIWKEDIFVIPSSVNEILLIPVGDQPSEDEMSLMIKEVNGTILKPKEILSDHVYVYKKGSGWVW